MEKFVVQGFGATVDRGPTAPSVNPNSWRPITKQQASSLQSLEDLLRPDDPIDRRHYQSLRESLRTSKSVSDENLGPLRDTIKPGVYVQTVTQTDKNKYYIPDVCPLVNPSPIVIKFPLVSIPLQVFPNMIMDCSMPPNQLL